MVDAGEMALYIMNEAINIGDDSGIDSKWQSAVFVGQFDDWTRERSTGRQSHMSVDSVLIIVVLLASAGASIQTTTELAVSPRHMQITLKRITALSSIAFASLVAS